MPITTLLIATLPIATLPAGRFARRIPVRAPGRIGSIAFAAAAACGVIPTAARAQTAPAPATPASASASASASAAVLPEVRVRGADEQETATSSVPGYTARRSATATKTDTPLNEIPQAISIITADQVRDQASQTMQEVLRYAAGVRAEVYGLDNRGDWFALRGGSEGSTLIDGLRRPLSGSWGVLRNEPYAFERIEVLRGPASVIAGQNGPGGVVNLVSKRPQAEAFHEVGVQVGSYGHKQVSADLTGPVNVEGTLLYRLVALGKDSGTQVDHAFDDRELLAPSIIWQPQAGTSLTAFAEYQRDESGNLNAFFPVAGTLRPAPNGPIPLDTFIGEPDWDTYGGKRGRVGYRFEHALASQWTVRSSLRHDRVTGKMRTMYANWFDGFVDAGGTADPNGTYLNRSWYFNDDQDRITVADLLLEGKLELGATRHTLLFGADGFTSRGRMKSWSGAATPLDVYDPVYGSFPLPDVSGVTPGVAVTRAKRGGLLVQDQIKFDERWVLIAGLRYDRSRTEVDGGASRRDSARSKNLGVVYLADGGWSPYASYSESFEPVTSTNPAGEAVFKPLRGKQVEAGVKWLPAGQRIGATASVYQLKERNRLAADLTNVNASVQRGEVTVKGVELEVTATLPAWDLLANYSYTDAQVTGTTADDARLLGHQLGSIPKHSAAAWALHKFGAWGPAGLRAGLGVRHAGSSSDGTGNTPVPSVTLFDALVSWDIDACRIALNVNNLTDKTYVATCLERGDCWYGSKRRAVLSVAYRW